MTKEQQQWLLAVRGVRDPCETCLGVGVQLYSSTATWKGGIGGCAMTTDVCDKCWGSGDKYRPGFDQRAMRDDKTQWERSQVAKWLSNHSGINFSCTKKCWEHLLDRLDKEQRRKKLPDGIDPFWYYNTVNTLQAMLRELMKADES